MSHVMCCPKFHHAAAALWKCGASYETPRRLTVQVHRTTVKATGWAMPMAHAPRRGAADRSNVSACTVFARAMAPCVELGIEEGTQICDNASLVLGAPQTVTQQCKRLARRCVGLQRHWLPSCHTIGSDWHRHHCCPFSSCALRMAASRRALALAANSAIDGVPGITRDFPAHAKPNREHRHELS